MSRFPDLLPAQRRILFEVVEIFRKHSWEGRAVRVSRVPGDDLLHFSRPLSREPVDESVDTDFSSLRVLDEAGYINLIEWAHKSQTGRGWIDRTVTLKRLASDYYDWAHRPAPYRILSGFWYSLRPFVLPALVSSIFTLLVWIILNWLSGRGPSTLP